MNQKPVLTEIIYPIGRDNNFDKKWMAQEKAYFDSSSKQLRSVNIAIISERER